MPNHALGLHGTQINSRGNDKNKSRESPDESRLARAPRSRRTTINPHREPRVKRRASQSVRAVISRDASDAPARALRSARVAQELVAREDWLPSLSQE